MNLRAILNPWGEIKRLREEIRWLRLTNGVDPSQLGQVTYGFNQGLDKFLELQTNVVFSSPSNYAGLRNMHAPKGDGDAEV